MNTQAKWLILGLTAVCLDAAADEPRGLANNPFQRPAIDVSPRVVQVEDDGTESVLPELDLRITLIAGRERLARVGDALLRPGDDVDGYTLVRVYENRAVFKRQGKEVVVHVKPGLLATDERRINEQTDD